MSKPQTPKPAKLVVGLFMKDKHLSEPAVDNLSSTFGPIDLVSPWFSFDFTDYYSPEMGEPLFRRVLAFKNHIQQHNLAEIKLITNDFEQKYLKNGRRRINIDPGCLVHERFVLATAKNFTHRISIGRGIYADLTLVYTGGGFQTLPWTYPDYAQKNMLTFLERVRSKYLKDISEKSA
ncbi:MAG: DUF4416 family protein [Thermodesulfobacteriota bacterium]